MPSATKHFVARRLLVLEYSFIIINIRYLVNWYPKINNI